LQSSSPASSSSFQIRPFPYIWIWNFYPLNHKTDYINYCADCFFFADSGVLSSCRKAKPFIKIVFFSALFSHFLFLAKLAFMVLLFFLLICTIYPSIHSRTINFCISKKSIFYFSQKSYFPITKLKVAKWVKYWVIYLLQKVELEKKETEVLRHFKSYYDLR